MPVAAAGPPPLQVSSLPFAYGSEGVILHLTSNMLSDLPMRVCEYLLEQRDRHFFPALQMVWVADLKLARPTVGVASTELIVLHGDPLALLQLLIPDPFLGTFLLSN